MRAFVGQALEWALLFRAFVLCGAENTAGMDSEGIKGARDIVEGFSS